MKCSKCGGSTAQMDANEQNLKPSDHATPPAGEAPCLGGRTDAEPAQKAEERRTDPWAQCSPTEVKVKIYSPQPGRGFVSCPSSGNLQQHYGAKLSSVRAPTIQIMPVPALLTLYLATVVETSAHNKLYEHFPHLYSDVSEDDLPVCVRDREIRRRTSGGGRVRRAD